MIKYFKFKSKTLTNVLMICTLCTLLVNCATTKQLQFVKATNTSGILGAIAQREGTLKSNIELKGFSVLNDGLKLSIKEKELVGSSLKRYRQELMSDGDSLTPPHYLEIEIIDDIGFAAMINNDIKASTYIRNSKKAGAITKIKTAVLSDLLIDKVDSYFLENVSSGNYSIGLYKNDEQVASIPLSNLQIFDYEISYFCFGKDDRNQIAIMDIVEEGKRCKRPLVRKTKKLTTIKRLSQY